MNYGDGSMYNYNALGPSAEEFYNYSQILFDANIYDGPWSLHSQIEFSDPPEIGISFKGLRRFTFSYDKDKYEGPRVDAQIKTHEKVVETSLNTVVDLEKISLNYVI